MYMYLHALLFKAQFELRIFSFVENVLFSFVYGTIFKYHTRIECVLHTVYLYYTINIINLTSTSSILQYNKKNVILIVYTTITPFVITNKKSKIHCSYWCR